MLNRIIRIAAVLLTLLLAGCSKTFVPTPEQNNSICFGAGSLLLIDDATTRAELKTTFVANDSFAVFGEKVSSGTATTVLNNVQVTAYGNPIYWQYAPKAVWLWSSVSDYYDFVAVSPYGMESSKMDISGNLAVSTHVEITRPADNCDLLGATYRRFGYVSNPEDTVRLSFQHLTSAVEVVVVNNSGVNAVQLDSIKFKNLMVCGDSKVTIDLFNNMAASWINTERNASFVREQRWTAVTGNLPAGDTLRKPVDFMIPQRLDQAVGVGNVEANMPHLYVWYTPQGLEPKVEFFALKNIVSDADGITPITTWEIGKKYTYYISMRLDGGLLVRVVTTDWEVINAETPGLLI